MAKKSTGVTEITEVVTETAETVGPKTEESKKITINIDYHKTCTLKRHMDVYIKSKKYTEYRDILVAVLEKSKTYTESEVVEEIEKYLSKGVQ